MLLIFFKASSKQQVVDICQDAFKYREKELQNQVVMPFAEAMGIDTAETFKVIIIFKFLYYIKVYYK